jgi:transposase
LARRTREEEERLLELYETDCTYEEMAEALKGRSEAVIRNRLSKLRSEGEKGEDLYIGGGRSRAERICQRLSQSETR